MLKDLVKAKLVEQDVNKRYVLTAKGEKAAQDLPLVTPNVVVTSPPKPKAQPNIVAVVAAWKAHFPSTIGVTVDELMAAGEENPALHAALLKIASLGEDDAVSKAELERWLRDNAGIECEGFQIKQGLGNWFLARTAE